MTFYPYKIKRAHKVYNPKTPPGGGWAGYSVMKDITSIDRLCLNDKIRWRFKHKPYALDYHKGGDISNE